jgi:hypothetical protein
VIRLDFCRADPLRGSSTLVAGAVSRRAARGRNDATICASIRPRRRRAHRVLLVMVDVVRRSLGNGRRPVARFTVQQTL